MKIENKQMQMIYRAIDYVTKELYDELQTRTGSTAEEFHELKLKLERDKELKEDDMIMVHNVFNEIIHGLHINNYDKDLGFNKNELNDFFLLLQSNEKS